LDGVVDDNDVTFMNLFYDGGTSSTHTWWTGDIFLNDGYCDDNDITILNLTYGLGIGDPLSGTVSAVAVPGAVGAALPMAALPVLMTAAAIEPELLVEEADVLAYAQAAPPRQAPIASASAAGRADAAVPAPAAPSVTCAGSASAAVLVIEAESPTPPPLASAGSRCPATPLTEPVLAETDNLGLLA
jgi:hypothetical protein